MLGIPFTIGYSLLQLGHINFPYTMWVLVKPYLRPELCDEAFSSFIHFRDIRESSLWGNLSNPYL